MKMMKKISLDDDYYKEAFSILYNTYKDFTFKIEYMAMFFKQNKLVNEQVVNFYNIIKIAEQGKHGCEACLNELIEWSNMFELSLNNDFLFAFIANYIELLKKQQEEIKEVVNMGVQTEYKTHDEDVVNSWDEYFYNVARQAARNSKCFSRRIGAILVKDNSIISTGYNGPPRGIPQCDKRWGNDVSLHPYIDSKFDINTVKGICPRKIIGAKSGTQMELCPASHAEENTILNCARLGISTKDTTMYMCCGIPCNKCMTKIINAGVSELVVTGFNYYDELSKYLLQQSTIKVRKFDFIKEE